MSINSKLGIIAITLVAVSMPFASRPITAQDQAPAAPAPDNSAVEVLARGPVHEAFAEPVNLQSVDPLRVEKAPPQSVEELPPDQKPEGENVQWILGYWAWDEDRSDFIWISGVWRDIPPGQRWVPGYWSDTGRSWTWTPGFWASEKVHEIQYLAEPPQTLEEGPQIEAPSANHVWVPGIWRYHQTRYLWRPGYWTIARPGWVWVPARYVGCPSGHLFCDGYWDYPLEERGCLFAPVYYRQPIFVRPNYFYTPSVVISTDILTVHLFARPGYCHYYFGDYYAPRYREIGIEPWLMIPRIRGCYDPLFTYYRWHHRRHGRDWHRECHDRYDFFARHEHYRPAHTYNDLRRQRFEPVRTGDVNIQNVVNNQTNLAVNLNQYVQNVEHKGRIDNGDRKKIRFARLDDRERRNHVEHAQRLRGFAKRRTQMETPPENVVRNEADGQRPDLSVRSRPTRRTLNLADLPKPSDQPTTRDGDRPRPRPDLPPTPDQPSRGPIATTPTAPPETTAPDAAAPTTGRAGERTGQIRRDNRFGRLPRDLADKVTPETQPTPERPSIPGQPQLDRDQPRRDEAPQRDNGPRFIDPRNRTTDRPWQRPGNTTDNAPPSLPRQSDSSEPTGHTLRDRRTNVSDRDTTALRDFGPPTGRSDATSPESPQPDPSDRLRRFNESLRSRQLQDNGSNVRRNAVPFARESYTPPARREQFIAPITRSDAPNTRTESPSARTEPRFPSRTFNTYNDSSVGTALDALRRQQTSSDLPARSRSLSEQPQRFEPRRMEQPQQQVSPRPQFSPQEFHRAPAIERSQPSVDARSQLRGSDFPGRSFERRDSSDRGPSPQIPIRDSARSFSPPPRVETPQSSPGGSERSYRGGGENQGRGDDNDRGRRRNRHND